MVMWGVADYLAFRCSQRIGGFATAFYVQALGIVPPLVLLPFWLSSTGRSEAIDWQSLAIVSPVLSLCWFLGYVAFYRGLERGMVSIVSGVTSAWLVVATLLAVLFFGETLTRDQALLIALIATAIMSLGLLSRSPGSPSTGLRYGISAMITMGIAMALWRPLTDAVGPGKGVIPTKVLTTILMWTIVKVGHRKLPWPEPGGRLILVVAAVLDSLGIVTITIGIHEGSLPIVAALASAHPIVTTALVLLLTQERPTKTQMASMAIAVGGVIALSSITG
jgi:drug/metabolite transporter (DMT)-like permease